MLEKNQTLQKNKNPILTEISKNIKILRCEENLTQKELALRTGLSLNTIVKIEKTKNKNISILTLFKIAKALKCDISQILANYNIENTPYGYGILKDINLELKNEESHFLCYIRRMIRETKKMKDETKRKASAN